MKRSSLSRSGAFTLVELLVSVGIFAIMTALIVAKYGNFNQSVLLTNLAYDVALTIRTAQTYGLSVKNSDTGATTNFQSGYGVHFDTDTSSTPDPVSNNKKNQQIIFFADRDSSYTFNDESERISTYAVKRGAIIWGVCADIGSSCTTAPGSYVDIVFKRPDPNAIIGLGGIACSGSVCKYAEITVQGTDGGLRTISVRENGQISVKD